MKFNFYVLYILFAVFTFVFSEKASAQMPAVQWGTYYGGGLDDYGNSVATDKFGNVYLGGRTLSNNTDGAIATAGSKWSNPEDGFVAKFDNSGVRIWGTYFPGEITDIACDNNGNLYVTGRVKGPVNFITPSAHQPAFGGDEDAFLVKLSATGSLLWGTYYGGAGVDMSNSVTVDVDGNVYIAGLTASDDVNVIATAGTHKSTITPLDPDRSVFYIAKFNDAGVRQWGTYYGSDVGSNSEGFNNLTESYSINVTTDINRNVIVGGSTGCNISTAIATSGTHKQFKSMDLDAFVAKFTPAGERQWGTYYGGNGEDLASDIICDLAGNIYLSGMTRSPINIASTGAHKVSFDNSSPQFKYNSMIVKLNVDGQRAWGTYYGMPTDKPSNPTQNGLTGGMAIDPAGFLYFTVGMSTIGGSTDYNTFDAALAKFESTTGNLYADTIIGDNFFDYGAGVAVDESGNVFLAGGTLSSNKISTPSGHQLARNGATEAFLMKFLNADTTVYFKDLHLQPTGFCLGDTFRIPYGVTHPFKSGNVFTVQLYNNVGFIDIGSRASADSGSVFCTIPDPFPLSIPLKIRIVASDPKDTTVVNALLDTVSTRAEFDLIGDTVVCHGNRADLRIITSTPPPPGISYRYLWKGPLGFTDDLAATGLDNPTPDNTGFYVATVLSGGCKSTDSIFLRVKPRPEKPLIFVDSTVCQGDTLFLRALSAMPSAGYHWNGPNNLSQGSAIPETYVLNMQIEGTGLYYVAAGIDDCYSDTVSAYVRVKPIPRTTFVVTNNICEGDTLRIWPTTNATDSIYNWYGPNGFHSFDTNVVLANVPYESRGNYVLAVGIDGCVGFAGVDVEIKPKPRFMATSNSPIYEGDKLKLDVADELFPGATYKWLGPDSFIKNNERSPERDSVDPDRHAGNYHVIAELNGCQYVGITNVIIYKLNYDELFLYPIPNNGNFKVKGTMKVNMPINVEIVNSANQLVGYDIIYPQRRRFLEEYWLEDNLANGQYYFRAKINGKWKVVPFTIVK